MKDKLPRARGENTECNMSQEKKTFLTGASFSAREMQVFLPAPSPCVL